MDGSYATLTAIRNQQSDDQADLKTEEETLPELEASAKKQAESLKSVEQQTITAKKELKTAAPLIQKIRSLDQKLAEQKKTISEGAESCTKDAAKIDRDKQARAKEQKKRTQAEKTLEIIEGYLKEHAQDEWLISGLAGVEEQLGNLLTRQKEIVQKEADQRRLQQN